MKQALFALVALIGSTTTLWAADDKPATEYYPLKEGTVWEYKSGDKTIVVTLEKLEQVKKPGGDGDETWARLVSRIQGDKDNKSRIEYVTVRADGVYRVQYQDQKIEAPGLRFFAIGSTPTPVKDWEIKAKMFNVTLEGKGLIAEKTETIEVPHGKYETLVCTTTLKADKTDIKITYYFAKGVGIVKQVAEFNDKKVTQELSGFKEGNK